MSRPTKGVEHVDAVEGPLEAKERLKVVLRTISGELSIEAGCEELGVSASRFDQLRGAALLGAVEALSPRPPGRPREAAPDPEVEALRRRVADLERERDLARVREDVAVQLPGLLRPRPGAKGGTPSERAGRERG